MNWQYLKDLTFWMSVLAVNIVVGLALVLFRGLFR